MFKAPISSPCHKYTISLSRWSVKELEPNTQSGLVARISDSTVWRWLHSVANATGTTAWIFPRDTDFDVKREGSHSQ
jgi:hypothetical protein